MRARWPLTIALVFAVAAGCNAIAGNSSLEKCERCDEGDPTNFDSGRFDSGTRTDAFYGDAVDTAGDSRDAQDAETAADTRLPYDTLFDTVFVDDAPVDAADCGPVPLVIDWTKKCPPGMAWRNGGKFRMLRDDSIEVTLGQFCIDETEVTTHAFDVVCAAATCDASLRTSVESCDGHTLGAAGRENYPLNCVTHDEAADHCRRAGKTLPTEAEWEWGARDGTNNDWPWGPTPNADACHVCGLVSSGGAPCRVGSFPVGSTLNNVADMSGNLEEWTDTVDPDTSCPAGSYFIRGGHFNADDYTPTGNFSIRGGVGCAPAAERDKIRGFRCILRLGP